MYICAWLDLVIALLMVFLSNALMSMKKVKLINHDCLPILVLLHILFAYIMLFAALSNAACLHNAFLNLFLPLIFANAFCFMPCLSLLTQFVYFKYDFPSCAVLLICWFFIILCSHHFFMGKGYVLSEEISPNNNNYYYYYQLVGFRQLLMLR